MIEESGLDCRQRQEISLLSTISRLPLDLTERSGHNGLLPGGKGQVREADSPPPTSTDVKNGGAIPPLPHKSLWRLA
jgi:hypothetical protein